MSTVTRHVVDAVDYERLERLQMQKTTMLQLYVHANTQAGEEVEVAPEGDGSEQKLKVCIVSLTPQPDPHSRACMVTVELAKRVPII